MTRADEDQKIGDGPRPDGGHRRRAEILLRIAIFGDGAFVHQLAAAGGLAVRIGERGPSKRPRPENNSGVGELLRK